MIGESHSPIVSSFGFSPLTKDLFASKISCDSSPSNEDISVDISVLVRRDGSKLKRQKKE